MLTKKALSENFLKLHTHFTVKLLINYKSIENSEEYDKHVNRVAVSSVFKLKLNIKRRSLVKIGILNNYKAFRGFIQLKTGYLCNADLVYA